MLYEEARVYLDDASKYGSVLGLDSIKSLLGELGNPQNDLKFIHIAGTNGKGSILACLSSILSEAGYRVGRYSSPTVMGYLERFQIDGKWMAEDELAFFVEKIKEAVDRMKEKNLPSPTVFEIETAIAFCYFKKEKCDYVVLETGMGGELDATNIVSGTKVCVFSSISMDHVGVLGNSPKEIAKTKAGIIKPGTRVVTAHQVDAVWEVLRGRAKELGCPICRTMPERAVVVEEGLGGQRFSYGEYQELTLHLAGRYQIENAVVVLETVQAMRELGAEIPEKAVRVGLRSVSWPGRFQMVCEKPQIIIDGAHNEDAMLRLRENIKAYLPGRKITAVLGIFKDKDYPRMLDIIAPYLARAYAVNLPNRERTLKKEVLVRELERRKVSAKSAENMRLAIEAAADELREENEVILVFGSLSYLGEAYRTAVSIKDREK
ncbi:folylpolyglutamate synthase/dihydrofolate synthase family protein [Roseburia hominis]